MRRGKRGPIFFAAGPMAHRDYRFAGRFKIPISNPCTGALSTFNLLFFQLAYQIATTRQIKC